MKDIKTKPKTTTKAVQNTPKAADRFAKEAVKDIKTVSKDVLIKNITDKQLDTRQSEQPQRAEVEATEQVENTYYSAVDTVYQKGKHFAENKLKQHRQQVKTRQNHTSDMPIHNGNLPKTNAELIKSDISTPNVNSENMLDTSLPSKSMPKTRESYIRSHSKAPSDLIRTPERAKTMPKQNTHTVTRNVLTGTKRPFGLD